MIFPDEVREAAQIAGDLDRLGLEVAAVNVNLKGDRAFQHGALSSPDAGVRRRAIDLMREAKCVARDLGTSRITCAPLADGYDVVFQADYRRVWAPPGRVDCASAASDQPDIVLHLEHKPAEPRTSGLLDTPAKVVRLCRDVGLGSVGITFNVGHAIVGGRLPAAAFADVLHARLPYYIHFCDATASWDWDLRAGSHHLWAWAEFLFHLKQDGYDGWLTADTFPVRQEAREMFAANLSITNSLCRWLERLDAAPRRRRVRPPARWSHACRARAMSAGPRVTSSSLLLGSMTRVRHGVLAFLFVFSFLTIVDRVAISAAKSSMAAELGIGDVAFGFIFGVFALGYALGQVPSGWAADRFGPRAFLAAIVIAWSLFTGLTALTVAVPMLIAVRLPLRPRRSGHLSDGEPRDLQLDSTARSRPGAGPALHRIAPGRGLRAVGRLGRHGGLRLARHVLGARGRGHRARRRVVRVVPEHAGREARRLELGAGVHPHRPGGGDDGSCRRWTLAVGRQRRPARRCSTSRPTSRSSSRSPGCCRTCSLGMR